MINRHCRLRDRLNGNDDAFGFIVQMPSAEAAEIVGAAGYDFVIVDCEHGTIDRRTASELIRAADVFGLSVIVRVPDHTASFIGYVLDAGACGVLVPHLRTRAETEAIVAAAKYGPDGARGACPSVRSAAYGVETWPGFRERSDRETIVWGLIEDADAVDGILDIVSTPGLDGLMFGPFDLSQALGFDGERDHPQVDGLFARVQEMANVNGVELVALDGWEPGGIDGSRSRGARVFISGSDRSVFTTDVTRVLNRMRRPS